MSMFIPGSVSTDSSPASAAVPDVIGMMERGEYLKLEAAASAYGVHKNTLRRWWLDGLRGRKLPAMRIGKRLYFHRTALNEFIAWTNQPVADWPEPAVTLRATRAKAEAKQRGLAA